MRLFVRGRKDVFDKLNQIDTAVPVIWLHAASLGEYEQGVPVMQEIMRTYPKYQWVITFFSPSGYEIKKNNAFAKATTYLPLDTPINVNRFLSAVNPKLAIFVKYEFWPNYLFGLKKRKIPTFLLSGVFRKQQSFFKWHGRWMVDSLCAFNHFFVQNAQSLALAHQLGFKNVTQSGDTRFDRVAHQIEIDNTLVFMEQFKQDKKCVVCGSTWSEGEKIIVNYINNDINNVKFVIAPHEIRNTRIGEIKAAITSKKVVLYSEISEVSLANYDVLIIDTIGLLTKIYSYADIAYVGGALGGSGLHNILEPATFGVPVLTGPLIDKFPEAQKLRQLAGLFTVADSMEFYQILDKLLTENQFRKHAGMISGHYINSNTGATRSVMKYLKKAKILEV